MATIKDLAKELGTDAQTLVGTAGLSGVSETRQLAPEQEQQVRQAWQTQQQNPEAGVNA